jgi:hypothetical protein
VKRSFQEISCFKVMMVLLVFALTACGTGGEDGAGKVALTLNGTWKGTATSDNGGSVHITLNLSQIGSDVSGTIACTPSSLLQCLGTSGTVSGTLSGSTLTMNVQWDNSNACNQFDGTLEGSTLKGRYSCQGFGGVVNFADNGNWTATLQ